MCVVHLSFIFIFLFLWHLCEGFFFVIRWVLYEVAVYRKFPWAGDRAISHANGNSCDLGECVCVCVCIILSTLIFPQGCRDWLCSWWDLFHFALATDCFLLICLTCIVSHLISSFLLLEISHHTMPRKAFSATCTPVTLFRKLLLGVLLDILIIWAAWFCRHEQPLQAFFFSSVWTSLQFGNSPSCCATDVFQFPLGCSLHFPIPCCFWVNSKRKSLSQETVTRQFEFFTFSLPTKIFTAFFVVVVIAFKVTFQKDLKKKVVSQTALYF